MSSAKTPPTPRTPLSPSFADHLQSPAFRTSYNQAQEPILEDTPRPGSPQTQADSTPAPAPRAPSQLRAKAQLQQQCAHLLRPLAPLLSIETGAPHPTFPRTLLHFHLLSHRQLDELAHFYHQRTPTVQSTDYPMPVVARWHANPDPHDRAALNPEVMAVLAAGGLCGDAEAERGEMEVRRSKRRRMGRFVGLRGMESAEGRPDGWMRREMERFVEGEIRKREAREREREVWAWKGFGG